MSNVSIVDASSRSMDVDASSRSIKPQDEASTSFLRKQESPKARDECVCGVPANANSPLPNVASASDGTAPQLSTEQLQSIRDSHDVTICGLFISLFGDLHRYIRDDGYWIVWNGAHWHPDTGRQNLYNHLSALRLELEIARGHYNNSLVEAIIRKLSNQRSLNQVVKILEVQEALTLLSSELDAHPHLVSFANAVLNTHTLQIIRDPALLRPLYLIKLMDVWFDPQQRCPKWEEFLSRIFMNDSELIGFVQKAVGLSLSGEILEERLFFTYGSGANGKTTFFEVLNKLFAGYHQEIDPSVLIKSKQSDQRMLLENLANLNGIRFATSNEIPDKATYNDMAIKQLCSRDTLTAKKIYRSVFSFTPSHKLWIRSNHKPQFNVRDEGMLRRMALIPFGYVVPADERIERFEDTLLREKSGILNWVIEGWRRYQKEKMLSIPRSMQTAFSEYLSDCDTLRQFIEENYVSVSLASTSLKDFTARYNEWCKQYHYPTSNGRVLANELRQAGWEVVIGHGNLKSIKGLGLSDG